MENDLVFDFADDACLARRFKSDGTRVTKSGYFAGDGKWTEEVEAGDIGLDFKVLPFEVPKMYLVWNFVGVINPASENLSIGVASVE